MVLLAGVGATQGNVLKEEDFRAEWDEGREDGGGEDRGGDVRADILSAALPHVPRHGWSEAALRQGALEVGMTSVPEELFPHGAGDLIQHFEQSCQQDLVQYLHDITTQEDNKMYNIYHSSSSQFPPPPPLFLSTLPLSFLFLFLLFLPPLSRFLPLLSLSSPSLFLSSLSLSLATYGVCRV